MIIGTMFLGKVKKLNTQSVQTKFFILGIPLFPISSMLVTESSYNKRRGISIPLNTTSVIAGYARLYCIIGAIIVFLVGLGNAGRFVFLWALLFAGLWAYFTFVFGKSNEAEVAVRTKLGDAIGLYALPEWFDFHTALNNFNSLQSQYKIRFDNSDWKEDLNAAAIPPEKCSFLYPLALFNYMIDSTDANEMLLAKADAI